MIVKYLITFVINLLIIIYFRAMALCLSLMIGRLGASAGSNAVGYMLEYQCDGVFYVFGGILLGMYLLTYTLYTYIVHLTLKDYMSLYTSFPKTPVSLLSCVWDKNLLLAYKLYASPQISISD